MYLKLINNSFFYFLKKIIDENEVKNNAVFPVSIPLVAGPSASTLSVLISKDIDFTMVSFYTQIFPLILTLFLKEKV